MHYLLSAGMGYTQDADMNQALYGPSITSQAILEGGVLAPEGMKELYSALDHVSPSCLFCSRGVLQ